MKTLRTLAAIAALVAISLAPTLADAGKWVTEEIGWQQTYIVGTTPTTKDTVLACFSSGNNRADTTGWFTTPGIASPPSWGIATVDSLTPAFVTLVSDTAGSYTADQVATPFILQVGAPKSIGAIAGAASASAGAVSVAFPQDSVVVISGDKLCVIPLQLPHEARQGNTKRLSILNDQVPKRLVITPISATTPITAVRAYVTWYKED